MADNAIVSPLVVRLVGALAERGVSYCHWKSNDALDRSASGENDLDLLVSRRSSSGFSSALSECGFKEARLPAARRLPGVLDYYGYDVAVDRIIHVHAHYQLVIGHDSSKNYRLPVEEPFLGSCSTSDLFPVPAPEFDYIIFVVRMMLKHGTWEAPVVGRRGMSASELAELAYLEARIDPEEVERLLCQHLRTLEPPLFRSCVDSLKQGSGSREGFEVGRRFIRSMDPFARRPRSADLSIKMWRRVSVPLRSRLLRPSSGRRLAGGGAFIAVVGGDGAGKSTAVNALYDWLRPTLHVRKVHLGKPEHSLATTVGSALLLAARVPSRLLEVRWQREADPRVGQESLGIAPLLHRFFVARDRYRAYRSCRRFADGGGIVIADRFPLPEISQMDGGAGIPIGQDLRGLRLLLARWVNGYYGRIRPPDLLLVMRVDPEVAVRRKTDESEESVRRRSTEIWQADWSRTGARVVDAGRSREEVLRTLKQEVWSAI